ncbi:hypothetical protein [Aeromicrobium sp.]|uniref:hypothetical protein n=1 Tax=Aeromicrobium sp. TaxID=1871063 RepID=UPI0028AEA0BF|nr:hypothetical protein [Aeromicrobium sp.]
MTDERAVADGDATRVLEPAAELMKTSLPKVRFLPNSLWNGGKTATDSSISFPVSSDSKARTSSGERSPAFSFRDAEGFLGGAVHECVLLRSALDQRTTVHVVEKVLQVHVDAPHDEPR